MTTERAPDLLGEVVAYRAWRVIGTVAVPMLASATFGSFIWHPQRWTFADCHGRDTCPNSSGDQAGPGVPGEHCSCGLYAARDRDHLVDLQYNRYHDDAHPTFIGEVGLAGKVIPGSQGWRAEKGRIRKLWVPAHLLEYVEPLRRLYGVEVETANTFAKETETERLQAIAERLLADL